MTTLDDAAEQKIRNLISFAQDAYHTTGGDFVKSVDAAVRLCWTEATEAAALKCEALPQTQRFEHDVGALYWGDGCLLCAAAIRGK